MNSRKLSIFVSSPSDVAAERLATVHVVERLSREFAAWFTLEAVLWEQEPLRATGHFQTQIPDPSDADIVVMILWSRLGSRLPPDRFRGPIDGGIVTGTEWEFEAAAASYRARGRPDLLFYRKTAPVAVMLDDDAEVDRRQAQRHELDAFINRWFFTADSEFKAAFRPFDSTHAFEQMLEMHLRRLLRDRVSDGAAPESATAAPTWLQGSPFRGLEPFDLAHAAIFHGRARARCEIREALVARAAQAAQEGRGGAFLLVHGMSGVGKSSLVRAGLLPDLMVPGMVEQIGLFRHALMRPGGQPRGPLGALATALLSPSALPDLATLGWTDATIEDALRRAPDLLKAPIARALALAGEDVALMPGAQAKLALIVDQFEELFTDAVDAVPFADALACLAGSGSVWVIATMRSDHYHRLDALPVLATLASGPGQYHVLPPSAAELGQMVTAPAAAAGLRFEIDQTSGIGLDETLRAAAGDGSALPLLQFTLDQLFERRSAQGVLTFAAYRDLGGLEGALARRAEETFAALPEPARAALPGLARRLVTTADDADAPVTARRTPMSELPDGTPARDLADRFVAARLFVAEDGPEGPALRVAHEALLRHWPRLAALLLQDRAFLRVHGRITAAAERWDDEKRPADLLLPEGRGLAEAEELAAAAPDALSAGERAFIAASSAGATARRQRGVRRARLLAASFAAIALAAGAAGLLALRGEAAANAARDQTAAARDQAAGERDVALKAESVFLAALSLRTTNGGDPASGALLARAALPGDPTQPDRPIVPEARDALVRALADLGPQTGVIWHQGRDIAAGFLPDGSIVSTADGEPLRLSRAPDGQEIARFGEPGRRTQVWSSRDSRQLATLQDETLRLFSRSGSQPTATLPLARRGGVIVSVAVAGDFSRAAVFGVPHGLRVIDLPDGKTVAELGHADARLLFARLSPDGKRLAAIEPMGRTVLYDIERGTAFDVSEAAGQSLSLAYSSDGRLVAFGRRTGEIVVVDAATGTEVMRADGHEAPVGGLAFARQDDRLLSTARDGAARVWSVRDDARLGAVTGLGEAPVAALSPDGTRLAVAGSDHRVRLFAATGAPLAELGRHAAGVTALDWSPDGRQVLSGARDRSVRLWQPDRPAGAPLIGAAPPAERGPRQPLTLVGTTPDGRTYTVSGDNLLTIDAPDGQPDREAQLPSGAVLGVAFDPAGKQAIVRSLDWAVLVGGAGMIRLDAPAMLLGAGLTAGGRAITWDMQGSLRLWTAAGALAEIVTAVPATPAVAGLSPAGDRLWLRVGEQVTIRAADTLATVATLASPGFVTTAAFAGDRLATAAKDGALALWNARDGRPAGMLRPAGGPAIVSLDASADGHLLLAGDEAGLLTLFDTVGLRPVESHRAGGKPRNIAFAADGSSVAINGADGIWRVLALPAFTETLALPPQWQGQATVTPFAIAPDGRALVAPWTDGRLRRWPIDGSLAALIARADAAMPRRLDPAERRLLTFAYD